MKLSEFSHIITAIVVLTIVSAFGFAIENEWGSIAPVFLFSIIIIFVYVFSRKAWAYLLDSNVEHRLWTMSHYGFAPQQKFKSAIPTGVILPLLLTIFSLGLVKLTTILVYETRALRTRASKRFGYYSYTEMTDWHNSLIGASGIVSLLLLSFISYLPGLEQLAKMAAIYAFWNMIPFSDLDGTQIFMGSRVLWSTLAIVTVIFATYTLIL